MTVAVQLSNAVIGRSGPMYEHHKHARVTCYVYVCMFLEGMVNVDSPVKLFSLGPVGCGYIRVRGYVQIPHKPRRVSPTLVTPHGCHKTTSQSHQTSMVTADAISISLLPLAATEYQGQTSFFEGAPPLPIITGVLVVIGFGFLFTVITANVLQLVQSFGVGSELTSEYFT
jgi:hypothetical protein